MFVPRQLGKNCIPNSITAILIELRFAWGYDQITDVLIKKYRRHFSITRNENTMIQDAMTEAGVRCQYFYPEGSLITALIENQVALAIAIQSSIAHAYPIKKDYYDSNRYLTINQQGSFFSKAVYTQLLDTDDVNFYAIRPWTAHLPEEALEQSEQLQASLEASWEIG